MRVGRRPRREIVYDDAPTRVVHEQVVDPGPPGVVDEDAPTVISEEERVRVGPDGDVTRQLDRVEQRPVRRGPFRDDLGWALLVLLILAAVGLGVWWYFARSEATRRVPVVTGVPVATAVNRLQSRGFKTQITTQPHPGRPGIVFSQIPAAGNKVRKGSTVQLLVSRGPTAAAVPNAVGLTEATARDRLVGAGFRVTESRVFNQEKPGIVVAQSPAAGGKAAKGATVRINVSKGTGVVIVPNVVGLTAGEAETKLAQAGLKPVVQLHVPSAQPAGTVVAQNPAGGQARKGSSVQLNVSDGTGAGASGATGATGVTGPTGATGTP